MALNPARILGLARGTLQVGAVADITVIDPDLVWQVDGDKLASKSKNSPWLGQTMQGAARFTVVGGKVVFARG
jgi:dihydroorotase